MKEYKRIFSAFIIICVVIVATVYLNCEMKCVYAAKTDSQSVDEDIAKLYRNKIKSLEKKFGVYSVQDYPYGIEGESWKCAKGLCYIRLVDFDKDGVKDLFTVWYNNKGDSSRDYSFALFTVRNNKCIKLGQEYIGADSSPMIYWFGISEYEGLPCIVTSEALPRIAYGIRDGKLKLLFDSFQSSENPDYWENISKKLEKRINLNGATSTSDEWSFSGKGKNGLKKTISRTKKGLGYK